MGLCGNDGIRIWFQLSIPAFFPRYLYLYKFSFFNIFEGRLFLIFRPAAVELISAGPSGCSDSEGKMFINPDKNENDQEYDYQT